MSRFKPGQLVTIDHTVYRIRSTKGTLLTACRRCAFSPRPSVCWDCNEKLGPLGYYEKMWKAGQLVTIHGIVFRVKKRKDRCMRSCAMCDVGPMFAICRETCSFTPDKKLPVNHYLQRIHPKR